MAAEEGNQHVHIAHSLLGVVHLDDDVGTLHDLLGVILRAAGAPVSEYVHVLHFVADAAGRPQQENSTWSPLTLHAHRQVLCYVLGLVEAEDVINLFEPAIFPPFANQFVFDNDVDAFHYRILVLVCGVEVWVFEFEERSRALGELSHAPGCVLVAHR